MQKPRVAVFFPLELCLAKERKEPFQEYLLITFLLSHQEWPTRNAWSGEKQISHDPVLVVQCSPVVMVMMAHQNAWGMEGKSCPPPLDSA